MLAVIIIILLLFVHSSKGRIVKHDEVFDVWVKIVIANWKRVREGKNNPIQTLTDTLWLIRQAREKTQSPILAVMVICLQLLPSLVVKNTPELSLFLALLPPVILILAF